VLLMAAKSANNTARLKRAFLAAYADTGNITAAARAAGISRTNHYTWMKADEAYVEAFSDADQQATDLLETEARRRAAHGVDEPVIHQGQMMGQWVNAKGEIVQPDTAGATMIPLTVKKYSDTLLIFLMKGARPEKYRDNAKIEHTGPGGGPVQTETNHTFDNDRFADLYRSRTRRNPAGAGSSSSDRN
jgi:hypothetical protein